MNRSAVREEIFKLLYSLEIQKEDELEQIEIYLDKEDFDHESKEHIKNTVKQIIINREKIKEEISKNLKSDWKISRVSKINLAILEVAIYEILYTDIPFKVSINEAVELAKKYGEDNASNFVNGILASIVKEGEE